MKFMDSLFSKYADPFSLLDQWILSNRFSVFISKFEEIKQEEEQYQFYLSKVWDKSYTEFKESLKNINKNTTITKEQIETTVNGSLNILATFNPSE